MRYTLLVTLLLFKSVSWSQCSVIICQTHGHKNITVFYKDGSEGAAGIVVNDSCMRYDIPLTEPAKIVIVDDSSLHMTPLWLDPNARKVRSVTIDNRDGRIAKHDTISLDLDDAPDQRITEDYMAGRISSQDSLILLQNVYEEKYINAHPDSFLAVYYLKSLLNHLDQDKLIRYRDLVKKNNSYYSAFKSIQSYIENSKFKSTPKIGDPLWDFQAKESNGTIFDTKSISNKAIVLFFWYSGCGPCHRVMPALTELYKKYASKGLEVLSISFDSDDETWRRSELTYHIPGISISDLIGFSSPVFLHYGVSAFPFFVVFDKNKKLRMVTFGEDEIPLIENKVKEMLEPR
jgi:thiol-disulfide isomerase/thioredoxin